MLSLMFSRARTAFGDPGDDRYWSPVGMYPRTRAGVDVDENVASTQYVVTRCSRLLTETPSALPLKCYQYEGTIAKGAVHRERTVASMNDVPARRLVSLAPNDEMTAGVFREGVMLGQVNWGNGFAEIVRDRLGRVVALWPIHPSRVAPAPKGSGYDYAVKNDDGTNIGMKRSEVLHVCGMLSQDGIWGKGIIRAAREDIGMALATVRHGASFFGSGAQPKGVVIAPGLNTPALRDQFRREWKEIHSSPDSAEVAILPTAGGTNYVPISLTNEDNQFIQTQERSQLVICGWYGVPSYMLDGTIARGIEQMSIEFILYSLYPWISKVEQALNFKLLDPSQQDDFFFEHDLSGLLRGDILTRINAYRIGMTTGLYTLNDLKRFENLPTIGPAGDVSYVPLNMIDAVKMWAGETPPHLAQPGSDHTGAPADSPLDQPILPPDPQKNPQSTYEAWLHRLPKMQREEIARNMADFERQLEERPVEWHAAARIALHDVLGRVFTKEANAAQRASKGDFDRWLHEFFGEHEGHVAKALEPACKALALAGVKKWERPAELAAWLRARSVELLRHSYSSDTPNTFARRLGDWPTKRAADVAEEILRA